MLKFLHNFLIDRAIQVKIENIRSYHITIDNGLPQRSVINVTLFLAAINDIFSNIQKPVKFTIVYVLTIAIFIAVAPTQDLQYLNYKKAINSLEQWSSNFGFKFSPHKTQCTIFNKKKNNTIHHIYINNIPSVYTDNIYLLGMILDTKFFLDTLSQKN